MRVRWVLVALAVVAVGLPGVVAPGSAAGGVGVVPEVVSSPGLVGSELGGSQFGGVGVSEADGAPRGAVGVKALPEARSGFVDGGSVERVADRTTRRQRFDAAWDPRVFLTLETRMEHGNKKWCAA